MNRRLLFRAHLMRMVELYRPIKTPIAKKNWVKVPSALLTGHLLDHAPTK